MQAVSIGHAGILIRAAGATITCDPWFTPAFFGSWFVFPRNDRLDAALMEELCNPDFLYVSHLHGDHFDAAFLAERMNKDVTVLLPDYPTRELEREFNKLGFRRFIRTSHGVEREIAPGVSVAIHVETSITDGPGGDSSIVVSDATGRIVDQNDCRTHDLGELAAHGPVDVHWLQFSGAIWYPMVYEMDAAEKKRLCEAKVESQFARAMRYVEAIDARVVAPSAGPPCFLDPDLWGNNMITGDEISIFPDQTEFMRRLAEAGRPVAAVTIPGTVFTVENGTVTVDQPMDDADVDRIFSDKETYLRDYQRDWMPWIEAHRASWARPATDIVAALRLWWEPLLAMAPTVRANIGANCVIDALGPDGATDVGVYVDFVAGRVEEHRGGDDQPFAFRFGIARDLLERVIADRAFDWSNSLLLSCRFTAWRAGDYNESLYNFLKSLSVEKMNRTEAEALMKSGATAGEEADVRIGNFMVQRRCPHRDADLAVFGEIDGCDLVCTLHGWRFDLETGACRTAEERSLRIRPAGPGDPVRP